MEQNLNLITLGVRDVDASRHFYVDVLGWTSKLHVPGEVSFVQVGHGLLLSLWAREEMAAEAGAIHSGELASPLTLAHLVPDADAVTTVLDRATSGGATLLAPATKRDWGGVSGYFADPDGFRWEIAWNPGLLQGEDGSLTFLPPPS